MVSEPGADTLIVTGTMVLSGMITGWLGYRIRYRGDVHLIAGYRRNMDANTDALSRSVGRVTLVIGTVTVLAGVLYPGLNVGTDGLVYWSGYATTVLVLGGYAVIASRRYVHDY